MNRRPRPKRLDDRAATARIKRVVMRRTALGPAGWLSVPLMILVVAIAVAVLVLPIGYALFGTDIPFVVNETGTKAPPSPASRIRAAAIGILCWAAFIAVLWVPVGNAVAFRGPHRFASRRIAFDPSGAWLARGRRIVDGLEWRQIQAVSIVEEWQSAIVPPDVNSSPFVELFPVAAAKESSSLLGSLIVDAPPPVPGIRGKRYVIPLDCATQDIRSLAQALDHFAPGKRIPGGTPRRR